MVRYLKRWAAILILTSGYGAVLLVARVLKSPASPDIHRRNRLILVCGTFHNPNWFYAHLEPLAACSDSKILLVADGHTGRIDNLQVVVPHRLASRLLTRAGAKFLWSLWLAFRYRPDFYMGYAIFPAATTALLLGRLFRRPACFQITSGPLELAGGGYRAENRILASLAEPSSWIEKLAFALTRQFELLVVRGGEAKRYIRGFGVDSRIEIITGSVDIPHDCPPIGGRPNDLIFVGRLTERKRPDRFLEVVRRVRKAIPDVSAIIVGDGPEAQALAAQMRDTGLEVSVTLMGLRGDVLELNLRSRIFVLTSRWEGVSIAMLEAMACGAVPVVSNVGDLRDIVQTPRNGYIFDENDLDSFAEAIVFLLQNPQTLLDCSEQARKTVIDTCSRSAITIRWQETLRNLGVIDGLP
jgi:glycosyltransferase involved in cell wall biosynthesis